MDPATPRALALDVITAVVHGCMSCNRSYADKPPTNKTNVYYLPFADVLDVQDKDHNSGIVDAQSWYTWGNETGANGTFALLSTLVRHTAYATRNVHQPPHSICWSTWHFHTMFFAWTAPCFQALTMRTMLCSKTHRHSGPTLALTQPAGVHRESCMFLTLV